MNPWSMTSSRPRRAASVVVVAAVGTLLPVACTVGGGAAGPVVDFGAGRAAEPGMIPCGAAPDFIFVGETSLAALGLANEFGRGPEMQRVGMVWVTAGGAGPREVCVQWPDGSGMGGSISDDWRLPAELAANGDAATDESGAPPLGALILLAVLTLIAGVSYVAFRGERS